MSLLMALVGDLFSSTVPQFLVSSATNEEEAMFYSGKLNDMERTFSYVVC
jgi:hypothetical protein